MLKRDAVGKLKNRCRTLRILANQLSPFYIGSPLFLKIVPVVMRQAILKIKEVLASGNLKIVFVRMSL
jgi:hypothetical protein